MSQKQAEQKSEADQLLNYLYWFFWKYIYFIFS